MNYRSQPVYFSLFYIISVNSSSSEILQVQEASLQGYRSPFWRTQTTYLVCKLGWTSGNKLLLFSGCNWFLLRTDYCYLFCIYAKFKWEGSLVQEAPSTYILQHTGTWNTKECLLANFQRLTEVILSVNTTQSNGNSPGNIPLLLMISDDFYLSQKERGRQQEN